MTNQSTIAVVSNNSSITRDEATSHEAVYPTCNDYDDSQEKKVIKEAEERARFHIDVIREKNPSFLEHIKGIITTIRANNNRIVDDHITHTIETVNVDSILVVRTFSSIALPGYYYADPGFHFAPFNKKITKNAHLYRSKQAWTCAWYDDNTISQYYRHCLNPLYIGRYNIHLAALDTTEDAENKKKIDEIEKHRNNMWAHIDTTAMGPAIPYQDIFNMQVGMNHFFAAFVEASELEKHYVTSGRGEFVNKVSQYMGWHGFVLHKSLWDILF